MKSKLARKALFVIIDEMTDYTGRAMCAILVGPLDRDFLARPFLIDLSDINRAKNQTIQKFVTTSLFKFFDDDL